jgi:NAD(P)-dependent dehydrogenase (short-subunit alcohol dehydrogenase family)
MELYSMKENSQIALVTGSNKGIGFATAKQLLSLGYFVYVGARDEKKGLATVQQFNALGFNKASLLVLDVADFKSVKAAAELLSTKIEKLDVLVNNAAIGGRQPQSASSVDIAVLRDVYETNFFGTVQVTQAMLPLMQKSKAPRIVNVSSELGSLGYHYRDKSEYFASNLMAYSTSKTAVNAFTLMLANELQHTPFKINSVTPGYTATDLTNQTGSQTPEDAAQVILKYATLGPDGPSGQFFGSAGQLFW